MRQVALNRPSAAWFGFWAAVLLVLPNCSLQRSVVAAPSNVNRGEPRGSAIFCEIERPAGRRCATPADIAAAIRLNEAAVALVAGQTSTIGLDDSPAALARCSGQPEVVEFFGAFPEGVPVCLNCSVVGPSPAPHASNAAVCEAQCLDLFAPDDVNVPPSAAALAFCTPAHARVATNFPTDGCFDGACHIGAGGLSPSFDDPRRHLEPVDWINLNGVAATGGILTRIAPTTGFSDTGASSSQLITGGDAYLEFTAIETDTARTAGLSNGPPPPGFITFTDIGFGILLLVDQIHVIHDGNSVGTFGPYAPGNKFRVKLRDNFDGTATVTFARLTVPCADGSPCVEEPIVPVGTYLATYPVRVDAMFREQGGTVTDARIVRIR